jgi:hypothetical protein
MGLVMVDGDATVGHEGDDACPLMIHVAARMMPFPKFFL